MNTMDDMNNMGDMQARYEELMGREMTNELDPQDREELSRLKKQFE